jgi:hypothetical protein
MAEAARRPEELTAVDAPPVRDPTAIDREYHRARARRQARVTRRRANKHGRLRFWLTLGFLLLASLVVAVTIWGEIRKLFGL